jgi:hypothetical protein
MPAFPIRRGPRSFQTGEALSNLLVEWLETHGADSLFRTCNNCVNMSGKNDPEEPAFCRLYNMTPPAHVVTSGCPSHRDELAIPF